MDLILWRHADAENGIPDEERRLSAQGKVQAVRMAKWLRDRLPRDPVLLVSPARRAQETARALVPTFKVSRAVGTMATASAVLETVGWPDTGGTVVVVGHQPTLGQVAALALTGTAADLDLEKGAILWLVQREGDRKTRLHAVIAPELL